MNLSDLIAVFEAKKSGSAWMAICPAHPDRVASLSIAEGTGGRLLVKCHGGCATEEVLAAKGLSLSDLFPNVGHGGDHIRLVHSNIRTVGLTLEAYAEAKRLPLQFLRSLGLSTISLNGTKAVRIPYFDDNGVEVAVQLRAALTGDSRFRWRKGSKPTLYGLNKLREAISGRTVTLVEGPSDAQTLWFHGIAALGLPSASTLKTEWEPLLDPFETIFVLVEPDNGGDALLRRLSTARFRDRVRLVRLLTAKDPSELYLSEPEQFLYNWRAATTAAEPWSAARDTAQRAVAQEAYAAAKDLLHAPDLIERIRTAICEGGYVGDLAAPLLVYLALTSRLLERPLNLAIVAPSSAGKNHAVDSARALVPPEAVHAVAAASERALIYCEEAFTHRVVIFGEADSIPDDGPAASAIRSIASDNAMVYEVTERDPKTGKFTTRRIVKEGPTGIITTSTRPLAHQLGTRTLEVSVSDNPEQTKQVMLAHARCVRPTRQHRPDLNSFLALQRWLEVAGEHRVCVPFADDLARLIDPRAVRMRRDFRQLLTTVQVIACLRQEQRTRTADGWVVANLDDYSVARELLSPIFDIVVAEATTPAIRQTVEALGSGEELSLTDLAKRLEIGKATASYRVATAIRGGWLVNSEDRKGHPAKIRRGEALPESVDALPSVTDLQGVFECSKSGLPDMAPSPSPTASRMDEGDEVWDREVY